MLHLRYMFTRVFKNMCAILKQHSHVFEQTCLQNAQFLYHELPIRLAKRIKELDSLPYGLSLTEPVLKVKSWYAQSFRSILSGTVACKCKAYPYAHLLMHIQTVFVLNFHFRQEA